MCGHGHSLELEDTTDAQDVMMLAQQLVCPGFASFSYLPGSIKSRGGEVESSQSVHSYVVCAQSLWCNEVLEC